VINSINPEITMMIASQSITFRLENREIIRRKINIALPPRMSIQGSFSLLWFILLSNQLPKANFILSQFTSIT
jgi:hypothetical protein